MEAVWKTNSERPKFPALNGDIKTDVLVIGGGITGILCGYLFKNSGVDCVVVEQNKICSSVTGNTTAKITCQHGAIYDKMIKRFGVDTARLYFEAQNSALNKYRHLCENIDCDFEEKDSYVYTLNDIGKIEREVAALKALGADAEFKDNLPLPMPVGGAAVLKKQAQFNPLRFAFSVAKDIKIFENTRVLEITKNGVITDSGRIKADKIIVATHFPFANKYGGYFIKMHQHRSYVIALKDAADVNGMYVDEADDGMSFRNYKDMLLLGGGGHRTGLQGGNWNELRGFASRYYPKSYEVGFWATQDCKTLDDIPFIGLYSKRLPNVYVATGFNKWGMTSSMTAAMILSDLINDKTNDYSIVFDPSRTIIRPQLAVNLGETLLNFLTPVAPRCPHLGCALKYNSNEHSWDCPCHGSRFTESGKLLEGPATSDKKRLP